MTISNTKYTGRTLYLMVEVSAGVYAQVGGLRADSLSIGNEEIDITDKSDDTWKKLLAGGNRTLGVSGSGFVTNNTAFEVLQAAANAGTPLNAKLVYKAGKAYAAPMLVTSCELNGEYNGAQQFSASLTSMNTPYIGIAGAVPTLDLNFAETGSIQPNIGTATMTFTRSTAALYRDVDGLLKSAAINVPRFEHDSAGNRMGYLPEPAATNLLLRSQEFNTTWTVYQSSVTANAEVAPDGTATADKLVENGATDVHTILQSVAKAASAIQYTGSVFAKAAERSQISIYLFGTLGTYAGGTFNLVTGATSGLLTSGFTGASLSIEQYRDGWWRCSITATSNAGAAIDQEVRLNNGSNDNYAGNGASGAYIWGAQLEEQPQSTSYIVTTTASATRGGDVLGYATAGITGYSATEGSLYSEAYQSATSAASVAAFAALDDGTTSEYIVNMRTSSNGNNFLEVVDGGVGQVAIGAAGPAAGSVVRIASAFKVNDFASSVNGGAAGTDVSGTMPSPNTLKIGGLGGATQYNPGRPIKRVTYYNTRVANADLVALTG